MAQKLKQLFLQFLKFGIVGLSNTAISLAIYYLFVFIDTKLYMVGNVIGFLISVLNAFYWSNKYVFKQTDNSATKVAKRLLKTYVSYGGTFLLTTVLLVIEVNVLHVSEMLAPIINLVITIPLNFIANKFWAFK